VTFMVAVISGAFAMIKIHSIRRKSRIDEFYKKVINIRDSIGLASSVTERNEAIASIRALQNLGFEMVISEKLAADESFRIFLELSNRAINDLTDMFKTSHPDQP
jgi:muramoyltetrapeptide carboxypeptidase LdcA involved in peptidoglycan recycling